MEKMFLAIYYNFYWNNKIKDSMVRPRSTYGIDKNIKEILVKMTTKMARFVNIDTKFKSDFELNDH
jgi:hypothetical protein